MMPYIWDYRGRVLVALACLIVSKLAMVGVPVVLKYIVDGLDAGPGKTVVLPVTLLLAYGMLRSFVICLRHGGIYWRGTLVY